jgi:dolichol-phosphate mannosyltransferase
MEIASEDGRVRLLSRTGRRGLVSALREGIGRAQGEVIVWMDADFSHPPSLIPRMLDEIEKGRDLAVASRYVPGGSDRRDQRLHRCLSRIITRLASLALDGSFGDYTSGFIAIRRSALDAIRLEGDYGEYFISLVYQAIRNGYGVTEVPYANAPRRAGRSKTASSAFGFARRGRKYLSMIFRLALGLPRRRADAT